MSIKLIAVDIDGTLLNSQRQVTPEVFQAIQDAKAAGVKVVIATGRPIPGVLPLLEELNLNRDSITRGMSIFHRGLLRGNPTAASERFGAALKELKERFR